MKKFQLKNFAIISLLVFLVISGLNLSLAEAKKGNLLEWNGQKIATLDANGKSYIQVEQAAQASGTDIHKSKNKYVMQSRLDRIQKKGVIRVGTTGDYKPFTYFNEETNEFEGLDIDAAKLMAVDLGVEVEFVKTSWPTLMEDLLDDKFDIAVGGISRNTDRQITGHLSIPYLDDGKSPLIREEDKDRFQSLEDIDQPDVTIGVNPGGTNQKFVDANIKQANVVVIENNLDIPPMVAEGEVDVMITDKVEAIYYASKDERLYAALTDSTFTKSQKGYLMHRNDPAFQNWVDLWMEEMELQGEFDRLKQEWIYSGE
ncbi:transporter substrate-binding domain-containing protein [Pseudalkalibacillus salsuginis]|uniref:transporter substrate-binding domain-containing protein n=1 Tax=Pseudalkalibacillus salsuginis TaxID=2910972 RepID=UPI001F25FAD6|nr:transporter substrate-binding domain-containing protein [Pseudalkalibacillus salsuginis]MCF6409463.1 transporter substrate-binding domain-containing protein [Pseudalkalibacillus salsuginis]